MAAVEQQQGQERPPVTQLEFRQAMRDFKTMFPEMDEDVIEVVLRSNNGAVDATIDQLLTMSTDNENERLRTELDATENDELPPCYSPSTPPPSYHQAVPYAQSPAHSPASSVTQAANTSASSSPSVTCDPQPKQQAQLPPKVSTPQSQIPTESPKTAEEQTVESTTPSSPSNSGIALCTIRKWQPPLLGHLPPTFLRLDGSFSQKAVAPVENVTVLSSTMLQQRMEENERQRRSTSGTDDPELVQYLEDERIALFLQNEEFMQELRDNKEFLSTLDRASSDVSSQDEEEEETEAPEELDTFPYGNSTPPTEESDAAFREKIRNMGKLSRKKFTQLARLFSRRKRRTFKPILGDGTNPSRDNLLLHEDEYSELSEEDSETEVSKKDTWNSHVGGQGERSQTLEKSKTDL